MMILYVVTNFTMTLREEILFPFLKESGDTYVPVNEDEIDSSRLNFYVFDGKHTISAEKAIVLNDKYASLHYIYGFHKDRLLHKDVPPRFITSLHCHQNMSNKQYAYTPFNYQVMSRNILKFEGKHVARYQAHVLNQMYHFKEAQVRVTPEWLKSKCESIVS